MELVDNLHRVSKNVPPLACCNFDMCEQIWIFFRRNVIDKVSDQKTLYYMLFQITSASALHGKTGKHENCIFFTQKRCISALPKINQLLDVFNLFDSLLILMLFYDSLNLAINALISQLLGAWFRINDVESPAEVGLRYTHNASFHCAVFWVFYFSR